MSTKSAAAEAFRTLARGRRSARRFQPDCSIPKTVLHDILETTLRSPSGFNLQPTQILMVQSSEIKQELSNKAMLGFGNQFRTKDASVLAVFLSDLQLEQRIDRIVELERNSQTRDPNYMAILPVAASFLTGQGTGATLAKQIATDLLSSVQPMPSIEPVQAWSYKNTSLAVQQYVLAATSHDLATCMMEGFDMRRAKDILNIPDRYDIPLMVATGYDYQEDNDETATTIPTTTRLDMKEVVFGDTFAQPFALEENEKDTAEHENYEITKR